MADETKPTDDQSAKRSGKMMQIAIVAALMLGEGVAVFFLANAMGSDPTVAPAGEGSDDGESDGGDEMREIELVESRPSNRVSGKLITFRIVVSGLVMLEDEERATALVESSRSRLLDRLNYVIRSAELRHLNEPDPVTIKRRLKKEFDQIFGDDTLLKEVLITEWQQSGSGI